MGAETWSFLSSLALSSWTHELISASAWEDERAFQYLPQFCSSQCPSLSPAGISWHMIEVLWALVSWKSQTFCLCKVWSEFFYFWSILIFSPCLLDFFNHFFLHISKFFAEAWEKCYWNGFRHFCQNSVHSVNLTTLSIKFSWNFKAFNPMYPIQRAYFLYRAFCCLIRSIYFFFPPDLTDCLFCGGWCKWMALVTRNQGVSNRKESRSNQQLCKCDVLLSFLLIAN